MTNPLWDNPLVLSILFHPRPDAPGGSTLGHATDGTISVGEGVALGCRLYNAGEDAPVVLYFHGNGEIASDHDFVEGRYRQLGLSLLVVDYRGYGWSTGEPLVSTLLPDAEAALDALPDVLVAAGVNPDVPLLIMGRSLGSAPASHLAHKYPDRFQGLIIESGFAHTLPLLARLGFSVEQMDAVPDPFANAGKVSECEVPLLVIHGEADFLIPVANGQALYDASPAPEKRILRIPNAGHNNLMFVGMADYFAAVEDFAAAVLTS